MGVDIGGAGFKLPGEELVGFNPTPSCHDSQFIFGTAPAAGG